MPKYRKIHVKIVESFDINEMPNDTYRLFWVLLPTQLCREGRGLDNLAWLKSRVFPLREDIPPDIIDHIMNWLEHRKMIVRYTLEERKFFYVPTFHKYQGDTQKEAESNFPPPRSGVSPELGENDYGKALDLLDKELDVIESESESESKSESESEVVTQKDKINYQLFTDELNSFLKHWKTSFPDKPQPRRKTISSKFKTRIKEKYFYDNWLKAIGVAAESNYLKGEGWFTAPWFLKNDENWEKCLNGNYAKGLDKTQQKVKSNREIIQKVALEYVDDES